MDKKPIESGGGSISLSVPLIQMSAMLNAPDVLQRSKASDVSVALNLMQAELGMARAEIIVLRVAAATIAEHMAQMRREHDAHTEAVLDSMTAVIAKSEGLDRRNEARSELMASRIQFFEEQAILDKIRRHDTIMTKIAELTGAVEALPAAYAGARFRRWLGRIF